VDTWEQAHRRELDYNGNLLGQETSQEFLHLSSEDLAVRVLTGYSEFAERLEALVEDQVAIATERRQVFLRNLNLSGSITRIDTALVRIAELLIQRHLPPLSPSLGQTKCFAGSALKIEARGKTFNLRADPAEHLWWWARQPATGKLIPVYLAGGVEDLEHLFQIFL
jgi:hypothetical protein